MGDIGTKTENLMNLNGRQMYHISDVTWPYISENDAFIVSK